MNRVYLILFLVILMTSVFEFTGVLSTVEYKIEHKILSEQSVETRRLEEFQPTQLSPSGNEALHIVVQPNGYWVSAIIDLHIDSYNEAGNRLLYLHGGRVAPAKCINIPRANERHCTLTVQFSANDDTRLVLFADNKDITIRKLDVREYKVKRASQLSGLLIFYFFIGLTLFGFLFSFLNERAAKIALVLVTVTCLSLLSVPVFLFISSFLLLYYRLLMLILHGSSSKGRLFTYAFFGLVLLLIFIKFLIPLAPVVFQNPGDLPLAIPLGFSYFVIKIVDLSIDCYKGHQKNLNLLDYLCYLLFPCTLPAGPIKTFKQYLSFRIEKYSSVHYASGIARTLFGVMKKLFADVYILPIINAKMLMFVQMEAGNPAQESLLVFQMLILNFIYIYLDFSAYCDMAIGSARAMGYNVPENFKWPLLRASVSEYWQHWHMTLSNWARKNVFMNVILSTRSLFLATFSTMLCIGLWHKPSFGWLSWAFHHTSLMRLEDYVKRKKLISKYSNNFSTYIGKIFTIVCIFYVWFMISLGQSFIIFSDINLSLRAYKLMLQSPYYFLLGLL